MLIAFRSSAFISSAVLFHSLDGIVLMCQFINHPPPLHTHTQYFTVNIVICLFIYPRPAVAAAVVLAGAAQVRL